MKVESTLNKQYRKLLDKASDLRLWRSTIDWGVKFEIAEEIKKYFEKYRPAMDQPETETEKLHANLLLFGSIGAGKSSFVNSVRTVFKGEFVVATKCGSGQTSETSVYKRHQLVLKEAGKLPIRICDMPGLENDCCITDENARLLLNGNIKDGMTFVPNAKVKTFGEGKPDDRIACVIIVLDATTVPVMSSDVVRNIYAFQQITKELGVREVVVLTKVDQLFEFRLENVPEIFQNKEVRRCVETVAARLNVPKNYVFPMKNYKDETELNDALNVLIFQTMKDILRMAETTLEDLNQDSKQPELFEDPWRALYEGSYSQAKSGLKKNIEEFRPFRGMSQDPCVNLLMLGPLGAGKSSFINTMFTVFKKRRFQIADVGRVSQALKKHNRYQLSSDKNETFPITFWDIRGFEDSGNVKQENIKYLLKGHINSNTDFDINSHVTPDDPCYNPEPLQTDCISTVVIVIDALRAKEMTKGIRDNIQAVLDNIDIQAVIVLTKIDMVCRHTRQNAENAFKTLIIEQLVRKVAERFEIQPTRVLPMKNYESEMQLKDDIDIVALFTLKEILATAEVYLTRQFGQALMDANSAPWRETINWDLKKETMTKLRSDIDSFSPVMNTASSPISKLNILCIGPVGSGKSSLINTVLSVLQERLCKSARRGDTDQGTTKKLMSYRSNTNKICLNWYDMPGLIENTTILKDNIEKLLKGHFANNTKLDICSPFMPEIRDYVEDPRQEDKIMGVIFVISADKEMNPKVVENMNNILEVIDELNIPHAIVLTKIDKVCSLVNENVSNAFVSEIIKARVEEVAAMFKMTPDMVHPMKNYVTETRLSDDVNLLTLYTLKQILDVIGDGLDAWQAAIDD